MIENTIQELRKQDNAISRHYILLVLADNVDEGLIEIYAELLKREDEETYNKLLIIKNLFAFPDDIILKTLSESYSSNENTEIKKEIIETIGGLKPELSIDFFIDNLDEPVDDLRNLIREHISGNFNSEIALILLNRLKDSASPENTEAILRIFIENGNSSIARKVLDSVIIKDQPAGILVLLFELSRKFDPFGDEEERNRTFSEIYFNTRNADDHIRYTPEIRKMEKHIESIGGSVNIADTVKAEDFLNPKLDLSTESKGYFLLNERKIYATEAAFNALKTLSEYKGQFINNQRYAELIDPYGEKNIGARALTTAISNLKSAINKYYPEFPFDSLVGQKYGKGYFIPKDITIDSK